MAVKASERFVSAVDTLKVHPADRLLEVSIDELVAAPGPTVLHPLCRFAGVSTGGRVRTFYRRNMSMRAANQGRWRSGLSERRATSIEADYEAILQRLEAAGRADLDPLSSNATALGRARNRRVEVLLPREATGAAAADAEKASGARQRFAPDFGPKGLK